MVFNLSQAYELLLRSPEHIFLEKKIAVPYLAYIDER